jgi:hypothetical protein
MTMIIESHIDQFMSLRVSLNPKLMKGELRVKGIVAEI